MKIHRIRGLLAALALTLGCAPAAGPLDPRAPSASRAGRQLRLVERFGSLELLHGGAVKRSVFLDASTLASAADDAVRIWDLSGKQRTFLPLKAVDIASPPSSGVLVVAEARTLSAFRLQGDEAKPLWQTPLPAEALPYGLEARGGPLRLVLRDRVLEIDPATGHEQKSSGILTWLADVKLAAVTPDGSALIAEHKQGTWIHTLGGNVAPFPLSKESLSFVVSPDSKRIVGLSRWTKNTVQAWDIASHELRWSLDAGDSAPPALGLSPDGSRVALFSAADESALVDAATGALVQKLGLKRGDFSRNTLSLAAFSPDGTHLSWGAQSRVRLWDLAHGAQPRAADPFYAGCAVLSPQGDRVVLGSEVWDLDRHEKIQDLIDPKKPDSNFILSTMFGATSSELVAAELESFAFWDLERHTVHRVDHSGTTGLFLARAERSFLAVDFPIGKLTLWRPSSDHEFATLDRNGVYGPSDYNYSPAAVASKDRFAVPLTASVEILDAGSGAVLSNLTGLAESRALAYSPDGQSLAAALARGIEIWSPALQTLAQSIPASSPTAVTFLPGGELIAYGLTSGKVALYDTARQALLSEPLGHHGSVRCLYAGGKRLVSTGTEGTVAVWEIDPR